MEKQSNQFTNTAAKAIFIIGILIIVSSIIGGCFEGVKNELRNLNINYKIDPNIVRGLDYYTKTVFEFISNSSIKPSTLFVTVALVAESFKNKTGVFWLADSIWTILDAS